VDRLAEDAVDRLAEEVLGRLTTRNHARLRARLDAGRSRQTMATPLEATTSPLAIAGTTRTRSRQPFLSLTGLQSRVTGGRPGKAGMRTSNRKMVKSASTIVELVKDSCPATDMVGDDDQNIEL
jgi:hypothetical protein